MRDPARYYEHNVRGGLSVLEAMRAGGVSRLVLSSSCAVYGNPVVTPMGEDHPTDPINAYGDSKLTVEHALRHYGRAYGLRSIALRYFNAAGADPDGDLGEDHDPRDPPHPARHRGSPRGSPVAGVRRRLSDRGRHLSARLRARLGHRRGARPGPRSAGRRERRSGEGLQSGNRGAAFRPRGDSQRRAGDRTAGAGGTGPRAGPGDPPVLFAAAGRIGRDLDWRPAHTDLDDIVATAWRWHERHPEGFGSAA